MFTEMHKDLLTMAKGYDWIVDLGTSDVVTYITDQWGGRVAIE
jgi:malonyl CoA-acyl carrier protein transacylase